MFSRKIYHVDGNVAIKWKSKFIWGKAFLGRRWTCKSEVIPSNSYRGLYPFYAWPLAMFVFVSSWFFAHLFLGLVSNSPLCLVLSALCLHFPFVCCFSLWMRARPISEDVINPGFVIFLANYAFCSLPLLSERLGDVQTLVKIHKSDLISNLLSAV